MVRIKKNRHHFLIEQVATTSVPPALFAEGKISRWDLLNTLLTEFVQTFGLTGMATAIHLPANLVKMQQMQLPRGLTSAAIETEIDGRLRRDLPGLAETLSIDYIESSSANSPYLDVFFVAARQQYLTQYLDCVNGAGLKVKIVDVDIYALKRCVETAFTLSQEEVQATWLITLNSAMLIISFRQEIIFYQHWNLLLENDLFDQFNNSIQLYYTAHRRTIKHLIICSAKVHLTTVKQIATQLTAFYIHYLDVFAHLPCHLVVNDQLMTIDSVELMLACGLALREPPKW